MRKRRRGTNAARVEAYLLAHPGCQVPDIMAGTFLSRDQARKALENLRHLKLVLSQRRPGIEPWRYWHATHAAQMPPEVPKFVPELPPHRMKAPRAPTRKRAHVERPKSAAVAPNRSGIAQPRVGKSTEERIEYREIDGRLVRVTIGRTHDTTGDVGEREVTRGCGPGRYLHSDSAIARAYP